jgi:hypothetical protein
MSQGFLTSTLNTFRSIIAGPQGAAASAAATAAAAAVAGTAGAGAAAPTAAATAAADTYVAARPPQGQQNLFQRLTGAGLDVARGTTLWQVGSALAQVVQNGAPPAAPACTPSGKTPEVNLEKLAEFVGANKKLFPRGMPEVRFVDKCESTSQGTYADGVVKVRNDLEGKQLESALIHEVLHHQATDNGFSRTAGGVEDGIIEYLVFQLYEGDKEVVGSSPYPSQARNIRDFVKMGVFSDSDVISMLTATDKSGGHDKLVSRLKLHGIMLGVDPAKLDKFGQWVEEGRLGEVKALFFERMAKLR